MLKSKKPCPGFEEQLLKNGQIGATLRTELIRGFDPKNDEFVQIQSSTSGRLLAIVGLDQQKGFYLKRVFKY
jgi:tRNA pseudouridine55 synthase